MTEFKACLDCLGHCCVVPLSSYSNQERFGEVLNTDIEIGITRTVDLIRGGIENFMRSMSEAETKVKGIELDFAEEIPGVLYVFWHTQFECALLKENGDCANHAGRPKTCQKYACDTVKTGFHRPKQSELAEQREALSSKIWKDMPATPEAVEKAIRDYIKNLW